MAGSRDYTATAKRYRDQAEEFRAKAELMADIDTRAQYDRMADAYERLADNEEDVVRNIEWAAK